MTKESSPAVAFFDFDGTITTGDSLLPFLFFLFGFWGVIKKIGFAIPRMISFVCGFSTRQEAKEAILTTFFKGFSPDQLVDQAQRYAETKLSTMVRPEALERIQWHLQRGDRCVVISASVSLYLQFWVKKEGISDLLCSELEVDSSGIYTGKLKGKNCWGPEKVERVKQLLGNPEQFTLYAYGDSRGDKELLEIADYPFFRRWKE